MFEVSASPSWRRLLIAIPLLVRSSVVYIPNDKIGIVEKKWSGRGSVQGGFIALHGEAGFQPERAARRLPLLRAVPVPRAPPEPGDHPRRAPSPTCSRATACRWRRARTSAATRPPTTSPTSPAFLAKGGQKGLQRKILREGTYAINLAQFVVLAENHVYALPLPGDANVDAKGGIGGILAAVHDDLVARGGFRPLVIREDKLAVVTTHEGQSLPEGTIVAPIVGADPADAHALPPRFPEPGNLHRRRRLQGPPAAGAGRRHLLPERALRVVGDRAQDRGAGRLRRRGRVVHRQGRHWT